MSSKIYFSKKSGRKPLSYYTIKLVTGSIARIAPSIGKKLVKTLLLTPVRHQSKVAKPSAMLAHKLDFLDAHIDVYELGSGPVVLFTHGWSGSASQFYPLMEKVASLGFKAVAFDHYAHGNSAGKQANLPLFVKGVEAVQNYIGAPVVAAISHSMGCIAALNKVTTKAHILIAPPFDFYTSFEKRILSTGISKSLFEELIKSVESEHGMPFKSLLPERHLSKHKNIFMVHDLEDKFAFHHLSEKVVKQFPHLKLVSTQGLGHSRVINDELTWQSIKTQLTVLVA
ncbi:alpha/beta hydrolase [Pseudoalteromonas sp. JBTF-M23]|uniref:Alpha/beta hydrolase n=1 Tax=Pseudoalteromonas caenipelagi TaxID=2726988 RepID=A0A849VE23_9GAMM|nr:alpha/beta hydrolase [Pseudoalteromonas caenipelagi]NOU49951.1 alpha/beta hydrolase [Pseudoalteromonas caenipelagi]